MYSRRTTSCAREWLCTRASCDAWLRSAGRTWAGNNAHGGFPPGRGTYRNAPPYAEAAVALELSESIEKLLLDDFDDEC